MWPRRAGIRVAAVAPGVTGAQSGLEAHDFLLDLRESPGALGAAVEAGRGDGGGRGAPDEVVDPLARVPVHARVGKQSRNALEAGFVAVSVTVCWVWTDTQQRLIVGSLFRLFVFEPKRNSRLVFTGGMSLRNLTVISRMSAFSSFE